MKYFLVMLIALLAAAAWYFKDQLLPSPHDSYYAALLRENLDASAQRWRFEGEESLVNPLPVTLPYSERRLLEAAYLQPITLAFDLKADQLIQVELFPSVNTHAEVFVDVFFLDAGAAQSTRIGSMPAREQQVRVAAERSGRYLVRIQPSHAAEGLIDIALTSPIRYGFPVNTERENTVQSFFGVDRDGGARRHEGIDIFAPRGTPVIAAEAGYVTRLGDTPRGGKNVWVRGDQRSFYYAHLDSIAVSRGDRVARGEVLGTVGNTGNAITTSPHLHFGIYKSMQGAVDPLPLVGRQLAVAAYVPPAVELSPRWVSVNTDRVNLRSSPSLEGTTIDSLVRGELVQVDAVAGEWLRIFTGSRVRGFVARRLTEAPSESNLTLADNHVIVSSPREDAPVIGEFSAGDQLPTLGQFGNFARVRLPGGVYGWLGARQVGSGAATPSMTTPSEGEQETPE